MKNPNVLTVVLESKLDGALDDQKNQNCELPIVEACMRYVADTRNADIVLFTLPIVERGNSRAGAGNGRVYVGFYEQEQVLKALADYRAGKRNALKLDQTIRLKRHEAMVMRQTFGRPILTVPTALTSLTGIEAAFIARGARFSTRGKAWEEVVQEALNELKDKNAPESFKTRYIGSQKAGQRDLQQRGDHIVWTTIPPMFW